MKPRDMRRVTLAGRSWRVAGDPADSYFQAASAHARGMAEIHAVAAAILPPDGVAMDVGANIGLSVLAFADLLPRGRVIAVEPAPRTAEALRRTIALNGLEERVAVEAVAVSAAPGEAAFNADAGHSAGSKLVTAGTMDRAALRPITVPVTTLDALAAAHGLERLDLVKVDVEGFEGDVLDGARETIARFRPAFLLEFNAWTLLCNRNANPRAVLEDWLGRFPCVHAFRGAARPERVRREDALAFLHDHLVKRRCADDLVLGFDDAWVERWRPPGGG
ncbi:FkbM family methyltransferase [Crenalkalicoccus roseus]|uniref:FkbM family methyltransferase n=1 Tax=Crenalkalicoccus roseus TaxID=1485588 RepID=UPI00130547FB|nr:FkbM family methyltransferase [Crenalkalicoccus roseus]